jgi:hypothetical protein
MSAPTAKKKAPAKRAAKPPLPSVALTDTPDYGVGATLDAAGFEAPAGGVQLGKKGRGERVVVPLFTTSAGKSYSMYEPSPLLCMEYLDRLRAPGGSDTATPWFMQLAMGEEARLALATDPDASPEDIANVYGIVARVAFGAVKKFRETVEGNS